MTSQYAFSKAEGLLSTTADKFRIAQNRVRGTHSHCMSQNHTLNWARRPRPSHPKRRLNQNKHLINACNELTQKVVSNIILWESNVESSHERIGNVASGSPQVESMVMDGALCLTDHGTESSSRVQNHTLIPLSRFLSITYQPPSALLKGVP